jgi:hypothetical protein
MDSWGSEPGKSGGYKDNKGPKVKILDERKCRYRSHACQGVRVCELFDKEGADMGTDYARSKADSTEWASLQRKERERVEIASRDPVYKTAEYVLK